jgi:hypothetical protein
VAGWNTGVPPVAVFRYMIPGSHPTPGISAGMARQFP